jgi:predicted amidophosphoribosyltransferase
MKVSKWILGLAAGALLLPAAVAQNGPIQHRKYNQQKRIAQGVRSGSLTARETARLERNQVRLNHEERRMKSDGNFTARERARVTHQQNRLSRQIYRQKHDAQYR